VHAGAIVEEFLFCESLLETVKAVGVLEVVTSFFAKQNFEWKEKPHTFCTDGAPAMLGNTCGFATFSEIRSSSHRRHSLLFTQTCTGNKDSSNIPERSSVNCHKSHQRYQKQVSDSSHF
jgi:hypothetical protein